MSFEELHAMGLSEAQARWMLARYREQALAIARRDPFRLAEEVSEGGASILCSRGQPSLMSSTVVFGVPGNPRTPS